MVIDTGNSRINYFLSHSNQDNDKWASTEITEQLQRDFKDVFTGIGCFGTFSLHLKPHSKPYQVPPACVANILQKLYKEELEQLQQQDIIAPLGMDETAESCNSFVLVLKPNGKVILCLDPVRQNQARPVHRGLTLNDSFPKLSNVKFLSLIDVSSGYYNQS